MENRSFFTGLRAKDAKFLFRVNRFMPWPLYPPRKNPPIPTDRLVRPRVLAVSRHIQINCMGNNCPQTFLAISLPSLLLYYGKLSSASNRGI